MRDFPCLSPHGCPVLIFNYISSISAAVPMHKNPNNKNSPRIGTLNLRRGISVSGWKDEKKGESGGKGKLLSICRPRGYQLFISESVTEWMRVTGGMVRQEKSRWATLAIRVIWGLPLTPIVHCLQSEQLRLNRRPLCGTFNCLLAC